LDRTSVFPLSALAAPAAIRLSALSVSAARRAMCVALRWLARRLISLALFLLSIGFSKVEWLLGATSGQANTWPADGDHNMEKLEKWAVLAAALVTIIGFPLLFISLWYAHRLDVKISQQLGEITKIAQSENSIALNTMLLNDSSNAGITHAIQNNKPVLVENDGGHSEVELDKFLGAFDTIALVYRDGFLSDDHLCSSFAFYIEEANKNSDVKKYLAEYPNLFNGIRGLLPVINNSKNSYCKQGH
jgi:hypothetical protein